MSLASALTTAVSALKAESQALSTVANNLANSSTVGYKANSTRFISLVTSSYTDNTASSGSGVTAVTRQNITSNQGTIESTDVDTDLAIDGNGFFVVTRKTSGTATADEVYYTRDGEFSVDDDGYLSLGDDYYLEGYAYTWDSSTGTYSSISSSLSALQVTDGDAWKVTSSVTVSGNLSEESSADSVSSGEVTAVTSTITVYDSSGSSYSVTMTFSTDSTTDDQWTVSLSSSDSSLSFSPSSYTVSFDSSTGALAEVDGSSDDLTASLTVSDGTNTQTVSLDFTDLTEYDSDSSLSLSQDGYPVSSYSGVTISSDGTVTATYESGLTVTVGMIALANFANSNGLTVLSDGMYQASTTSGTAMIGTVGENGTGTLDVGALEDSTTDTATEFTDLIVCQQAYSAAAQVVTTSNEMCKTLIDAV